MARVPFRVSARAARLIGRENVATSQGAVTELVKNAYDADAEVCAVLFVPRWKSLPATFTAQELDQLTQACPAVSNMVTERNGAFALNASLSDDDRAALNAVIPEILDLW